MRYFSLLLIVCWLFHTPVAAQESQVNDAQRKPAAMLAVGTSMLAYSGELGNYQSFSAMFYGRLVQTRHRWINPAIEFGWGQLTGNNVFYTSEAGSPNRSFTTSFFQFSGHAQLNIIKKPHQRLYISQGAGLMRFNPKDNRNRTLINQPATRATDETYGNFAFMLPTAIGGTYQFPNYLGLGLEVGLMNTRTDYLDNISQLGDPATKDNALSIRFSVVAPLSYDSPDRDAVRKERLAKRREEIKLKNQREREAFEKLKNQPKGKQAAQPTKKIQTKKAPAKKTPTKKAPVKKTPAKKTQQKRPKLFGIF